MTEIEPVAEVYSVEDTRPPTPWSEARRWLAEGQWYWLATVRPDGSPHVVPLLAVWQDGTLCFCSGRATRKARNLAVNAQCVIAVDGDALHLVVEGTVARVRDEAALQRIAAAYASKYGWHVTVRDGAFHAEGAPTAGPPPFDIYAVTPTTVFSFGTDETFNATRWRF